MSKLSEIFGKLKEKVTAMNTGKKMAFGLLFSLIIVFLILYASYSNANKYGVLFSDLSPEDSKVVSEKLSELKVEKKVSGSTIYVLKEQVDELRLEMAPDLSNGSKGYELLDGGNSFGMTDEEFNLKKLRATQGELERTIKSFPQIENSRVHITPSEDSVFVKEAKQAKAAVYIQLKSGAKLSNDNIKSIMALVSGSVMNLPKENIEVIDDKMNLLSKGVIDEDNPSFAASVEKQATMEMEFEKKLETALMDILEPAIGKDKVNVKINADLDFDANEKTVINYDPNKVEASTQKSEETNTSGETATTGGVTDEAMGNNGYPSAVGTGNSSTKKDETINYKVGQTEEKTIKAPGEVKRLTASVIIDGKLDEATKADVEKLAAGVIGFKLDRGDEINVIGMTFDPSQKEDLAAAFKTMNEEAAKQKRMELYKTIGMSAGAFIGLIAFIIFLFRISKKPRKGKSNSIDVVIGGEVPVKEPIRFKSLDLDTPSENNHIEQEIKKYATEKPEQVADIIKSWLAEDER